MAAKTTAATVMAAGTDNNQLKLVAKNTVAVATAMETAAVGAATTATGVPMTDHIPSQKQRRRRP